MYALQYNEYEYELRNRFSLTSIKSVTDWHGLAWPFIIEK